MELLRIPAFGRAFVALFSCGIAFPILGIYILSLDLIPVRFGVMHLSLLGATIGLIIGIDPIFLSVFILDRSRICRFSLELAKNWGQLGRGYGSFFMTASLGIVFILFYKANVHAIEAFNLFWGNVLALDSTEVRTRDSCIGANSGWYYALFEAYFGSAFRQGDSFCLWPTLRNYPYGHFGYGVRWNRLGYSYYRGAHGGCSDTSPCARGAVPQEKL